MPGGVCIDRSHCAGRRRGRAGCWGIQPTADRYRDGRGRLDSCVRSPGIGTYLLLGGERIWTARPVHVDEPVAPHPGTRADGRGSDRRRTSVYVRAVTFRAGYVLAACALRRDRTVACWGSNMGGALGDGTTVDRPIPVPVTGLTDVVQIGAGGDFTCARHHTGRVACWGSSNMVGTLGDGSLSDRAVPGDVPRLNAVDLALGVGHACAVGANGRVYCWGSNYDMALGVPSIERSLRPLALPGVSGAVRVSTGLWSSCALLVDGTVVCWGENSSGQLGHGTDGASSGPVVVVGLPAP